MNLSEIMHTTCSSIHEKFSQRGIKVYGSGNQIIVHVPSGAPEHALIAIRRHVGEVFARHDSFAVFPHSPELHVNGIGAGTVMLFTVGSRFDPSSKMPQYHAKIPNASLL